MPLCSISKLILCNHNQHVSISVAYLLLIVSVMLGLVYEELKQMWALCFLRLFYESCETYLSHSEPQAQNRGQPIVSCLTFSSYY
jgi:hypothetical protein